jgi:sigma-E factor negative regulatory protein RseB
VSQLVYSDGLTSVSVYASALPPNQAVNEGASVQGTHQVFARQVGDHMLTAFGDARPAAVKSIAAGISRRP